MPGWQGEDANDDITVASVVAAHVATLLTWRRREIAARAVHRPRYRGSIPGRAGNRPRDFELGLKCILRDYFGLDGVPPVFGREQFERRFRFPMPVFLKIYRTIKDRPFWAQRVNATGRPQAHLLQKLVAAFRVLAYGESYDRADEYVRLSRSTIARAVQLFTEFLVDDFGPVYLRPPTLAEVGNILSRNAERGMPGCLGSLDCSHWEWSSLPKALAGAYQDRHGQCSVVIEAICDEDTWIHHIFAGCPGSLNDVNVLYQSSLYIDVIMGKWPPRDYPFTVNGKTRTLLYYLVDGIYPRFAFLVAPYRNPRIREERTFNRLQEALRKDVERLFGTLTARSHMMLHPSRFWSVPRIISTTQAVATLHNMVVEARRDGFLSGSRSPMYRAAGGNPPGAGAGAGAADSDLAGVASGAGAAAGGAAGLGAAAAVGGAAGAAGLGTAGGAVGMGAASGGAAGAAGLGAVARFAGAGAAAAAGCAAEAAGAAGVDAVGGSAGDGAAAAAGGAAGAAGAAGVGAVGGSAGAGAASAAAVGGAGAAAAAGVMAEGGSAGIGAAAGGAVGAEGPGAAGAAVAPAAASAAAGAAAAGEEGELENTPVFPPPVNANSAVAPMAEFMRVLLATGDAKSLAEHEARRDDLCAHIFAERGSLLAPYLQ